MTSDKSYDVEQRLNALMAAGGVPGPWTQFNPLSNSWAVQSPFTKAWCRWMPGNLVYVSATMTPGTNTDGIQVGTIPSADSAGNSLRPAQQIGFPVGVDLTRQAPSSGPFEGAYFTITSAGSIFCHGIQSSATVVYVSAFYPLDSM